MYRKIRANEVIMESIALLLSKLNLYTYDLFFSPFLDFDILLSSSYFQCLSFTDRDTLLYLTNILQFPGILKRQMYIHFHYVFFSLKLLCISFLSPLNIFREQATFSFPMSFLFCFCYCFLRQYVNTAQSPLSLLHPSPDITTILNFMCLYLFYK